MSGYLYFDGSGSTSVDALLETLERVGTWYHNTSQWPDDSYVPDKSCLDLIQDAAQVAADEIAQLRTRLAEVEAELVATENYDIEEIVAVRARLADVSAARDEACDIAFSKAKYTPTTEWLERVGELRQAGKRST